MPKPITINPKHEAFLACENDALVLGGPGAGKTTIALIKAGREIAAGRLKPHQKILFVSFARATVARVGEKAKEHLSAETRQSIEIDTYHGFTWKLLRSHGYLIGLRRMLGLITPPDEAAWLAELRAGLPDEAEKKARAKQEQERLAFEDGRVPFDLFAQLSAQLLKAHEGLRDVFGLAYPTIVLDEFQDTNAEEWQLIQELGKSCRLIALADPDQRIYEFRGADPARIKQFIEARNPLLSDLGDDNHRSEGTDIADFGNDLLTGKNRGKIYKEVKIVRWKYYAGSSVFQLRTEVIGSIKRLIKAGEGWSVAVLVPTKRMMVQVSDALNGSSLRIPSIRHSVSIDPEGPTLAARVIACLMEPAGSSAKKLDRLIEYMSAFYRGRGGSDPNTTDLRESASLQKALESLRSTGKLRAKSILGPIIDALEGLAAIVPTGDPEEDWLAVRRHLAGCGCKRLQFVADQARYVRLLGRGSLLRETLSTAWRSTGTYKGAVAIVDQAFAQEHFANSTRPTLGVIIMNMHKAKGKEFEEVILYEGDKHSRYLRGGCTEREAHQALLNLRVSVTRARQKTTILTPHADPSPLIV